MLKTIIKKIFNWLNIKPDENQKYLIASMFFSGLLITYSSPTITKAIISDLPAEWLAIDSLTSSLSALFIGMMWKGKVREQAIKWFFYLTIGESVLGCLLGLYLAFVEYNVWVYAIVSLIYTNFISIFVGKCIMVFRTKLWNEHKREEYDNNAAKLEELDATIESTREKLGETGTIRTKLENQIEILKEQIKAAKGNEEHLTNRNLDVSKSVADKDNEAKEFVDKKALIDERLKEALGQKEALKVKLEEVQSTIEEFNNDIEANKTRIIEA